MGAPWNRNQHGLATTAAVDRSLPVGPANRRRGLTAESLFKLHVFGKKAIPIPALFQYLPGIRAEGSQINRTSRASADSPSTPNTTASASRPRFSFSHLCGSS
jgi:hypothetical protein